MNESLSTEHIWSMQSLVDYVKLERWHLVFRTAKSHRKASWTILPVLRISMNAVPWNIPDTTWMSVTISLCPRKTYQQTLVPTLGQPNPMRNFRSYQRSHSMRSRELRDWWSRRDQTMVNSAIVLRRLSIDEAYVLASEGMVRVARNGLSKAVHTLGVI